MAGQVSAFLKSIKSRKAHGLHFQDRKRYGFAALEDIGSYDETKVRRLHECENHARPQVQGKG